MAEVVISVNEMTSAKIKPGFMSPNEYQPESILGSNKASFMDILDEFVLQIFTFD